MFEFQLEKYYRNKYSIFGDEYLYNLITLKLKLW